MSYLFRKHVRILPGVSIKLNKQAFSDKRLELDNRDGSGVPEESAAIRQEYLIPDSSLQQPESNGVTLLGWALLFLAVLDGVVLWFRQ